MRLAGIPGAGTVLRRAMPTVTRLETADPVVALTFDDGPNPDCTPELLRVLERHGARATFFLIGERAAAHPDLVERITAAGHAVGNHTWSHPSLPTLRRHERRRQIQRCEAALGAGASRLFRPPFGHQTARSWWDARRLGYRVVAWSVVAFDWEDVSADDIAGRLRSRTRPGSVVLLHDGLATTREDADKGARKAMVEAVDTVLGELGDCYRFLPLPELLARYRPAPDHWRMR